MNRLCRSVFLTLLAAVGLGVPAGRLAAQAPKGPAPEIYMMHIGAGRLLEDLRGVMDMTTPAEQRYYSDLKEFLDLSLVGVSRDRPLRVDILTGPSAADLRAGRLNARAGLPAVRSRTSIPVQDEKEFWEDNLEKNGIEKERQIFGTVYKLKGDVYPHFVRFLNGYAAFTEFLDDLPPVDPGVGMGALLGTGREMGLYGRNTEPDTVARRSLYDGPDGVRAAIAAGVVKLKEERQDEFELRQLVLDILLDELGRLYVDGREVLVASEIDPERQLAWTDMSAEPLPDTDFAAAVATAGQTPSRFAAVPPADDAILSLRVHHPLDPMRQKNLKRFFEQVHTLAKNRIRENTERSADEKAAAARAADQIKELLTSTVDAGLGDGFVEVWPADGRHTLVAAFRTVDGTKAVDILKTIQSAGRDRNVRLEIETAGEVTIHSFDLDPETRRTYRELTGSNTLFVGTSKDVIWLAGGPDAAAALKDAVEKSQGEPPQGAAETVASFAVAFGPWLRIRETVQGDRSGEQMVKWRQLALAAAEQGDDGLRIRLWRDGGLLRARTDYQAGILRFLGKAIADFSKENLSEQ